MKDFLASPIRVFDALNCILLIGGLIVLALIRIPECPGVNWLVFTAWAALAALYFFQLRPMCMNRDSR